MDMSTLTWPNPSIETFIERGNEPRLSRVSAPILLVIIIMLMEADILDKAVDAEEAVVVVRVANIRANATIIMDILATGLVWAGCPEEELLVPRRLLRVAMCSLEWMTKP